MKWTVKFLDEFEPEFYDLPQEVKDEMLAEASFVEMLGPETGRPHVDKLHGSDHANMKELRFEAANGEWRVAFAFDPKRQAILLVAGDKTGVSDKKFYKRLIEKADERYSRHVEKLKAEEKTAKAPAKKGGKKGKKR
ncbi:MAG: type II toxin-antitoxin system RelE/ParE family toxin [Acidobacteriaceae bacterium]